MTGGGELSVTWRVDREPCPRRPLDVGLPHDIGSEVFPNARGETTAQTAGQPRPRRRATEEARASRWK